MNLVERVKNVQKEDKITIIEFDNGIAMAMGKRVWDNGGELRVGLIYEILRFNERDRRHSCSRFDFEEERLIDSVPYKIIEAYVGQNERYQSVK